MINYILQVILFQVLFLAVYDIFLKNETFFRWNRGYLLATPLLAFIIPLLKLESIQTAVPKEYITYLPEVVINPQVVIEQSTNATVNTNYMLLIFLSGVLISTLLFLVKLTKIIKLITANKVIKKEGYSIVVLKNKEVAFSFFNYIFINEKHLKNTNIQIIEHELIHCRQKHTFDLLLFEFFKIGLWFNPIIYQFQQRITILHEYLSDEEIVKQTTAKSYFNTLLSETFNVENITFINQFYKQNLIKKRIAMITKNKSQKMKQLKYLLIVPLLLFMVIYSSCTNDSQSDIKDVENLLHKKPNDSKGFYFEGNDGLILFTGSSLEGNEVPYSEMTKREQKIYNKFKTNNVEGIEMQVVIDKNKDRVIFLKTNKTHNYKGNTKKNVDYVSDGSVPFSTIDEVPIYPGCKGDQETLKKCFQNNITQFVGNNFNSEISKGLGLSSGVKRIFVMFKIDEKGNITDIRARAPHIKLEEEAIRVMKLLPKMIPGKQKGKTVAVLYSLPIAFNVEGDSLKNADRNNILLNSRNTKKPPLFIFDGKEISKEEMKKIDAKLIKKVNVLKGETAVEKYGKKGENGVIEIVKKH